MSFTGEGGDLAYLCCMVCVPGIFRLDQKKLKSVMPSMGVSLWNVSPPYVNHANKSFAAAEESNVSVVVEYVQTVLREIVG